MRFRDQHAVITGGSSGIGLAVAQAFVAQGGAATLVGRDPEKLAKAAEIVGGGVKSIAADVTSEPALKAMFAQVGAFDHLVTSAGPMPRDGHTLKVSIDDARALFEGKYWGQFLTARYAAPSIAATGSITMFSGTVARKPAGGVSIFASIDGAIESLCRIMAIDLSPIRVNVVAPGIVDTPMLQGDGPDAARAMLAGYAGKVLVGRAGQPEDIAKSVLFLMENTFITGAVLDVDGGKK